MFPDPLADCIYLLDAPRYRRVAKTDIRYVLAQRSYTEFHLLSGERLLLSVHLGAVLPQLADPLLVRLDRNVAINLRHVEAILPEGVMLAGEFLGLGAAARQRLLGQLRVIRTRPEAVKNLV